MNQGYPKAFYAFATLALLVVMGGCASPSYMVLSSGQPVEASPGKDEALRLLLEPVLPDAAAASRPALDPDGLARAVHERVNTVRREHGLEPLRWGIDLVALAEGHSRDMAEHGYFDHVNRYGDDASRRALDRNIRTQAVLGGSVIEGVGENLFLTQRYSSYLAETDEAGRTVYTVAWKPAGELAHEAVEAWMRSPSHRANLLSPLYTTQAIGIAFGSGESVFVTQNFVCRRPSAQHALAARSAGS